MLEIAAGLVLYYVFVSVALPLLAILAIVPFVLMVVNGKGYGHNLKSLLRGIVKLFRLGTSGRNKQMKEK